MQKWKPDKEMLEQWIDEGKSFRQIKGITGFSITTISKWLEEYEIEKPSVGRKRGYKCSTETKRKMSEAAMRD
jgi:transposase